MLRQNTHHHHSNILIHIDWSSNQYSGAQDKFQCSRKAKLARELLHRNKNSEVSHLPQIQKPFIQDFIGTAHRSHPSVLVDNLGGCGNHYKAGFIPHHQSPDGVLLFKSPSAIDRFRRFIHKECFHNATLPSYNCGLSHICSNVEHLHCHRNNRQHKQHKEEPSFL